MDIDRLVAERPAWLRRIARAKSDPPGEWTWYGYDILANVDHLDALVDPETRNELRRLGACPVADIGCADGDLGFLLAARGHPVDLIDWPATNWNGFRGARVLCDRLESPAKIHEVELDSQFVLPRADYGVALFLGILYHLKNPFFALEQLSRHARYCFLSTRIARYFPDDGAEIAHVPVAYLLGPDECGGDATNYWIFSMAGLERLAARSGWRILRSMRVGARDSNPRDNDRDERAFLLLQSVHA